VSSTGSLLEAQHKVLESIVRGRPLSEVLHALCEIVEQHAGMMVRAAVLLHDEPGPRLFTGAAPSTPAAYKSAWSMPISASSGETLGTFATYLLEAREPTQEERRLVEVLAQTASLAIERARADRTLESGARRDRFLAELAAATQPLASPQALMQTTARLLAEHLGASRCAYAEVKDDTFVITGNYAPNVPSIVGSWPIAAFGPACQRDMHEERAFVVTDTDSHPDVGPEHLPAYRATSIRAAICVPLHKHGRLTAAMAVHQSQPRVWLDEEVELTRLVVARCWEALERTRVARTLQASEARYRAMIEASPDCVTLIAADGTLLQINDAGLSMLELDEASALGSSIFEWIAPAHRRAFEHFHRSVCRGEHGTLELELIGKRGSRRWMEVSAASLVLENTSERAHLAIARDMTARVAAESALAQSRARLDYAVELSGVGFWYCDLPFDELIWDERVKAHFFLPADARVTIDSFYEHLLAEDRESTRMAIERSIETHTPYDVMYRTECRKTGEIKWIRALGGTAYDEAGQPRRFDGVTLDVTAQRRAQDKLAELLEREQEEGRVRAELVAQLRDQERRKDEFLATLAHELRNPLAALRFGLDLTESAHTPELAAKAHAAMDRQLTHLVRMVDDLLDASRVTLGKLTLRREQLDFRDVLESALETTRPTITANGQELRVIVPALPLPIACDPTRLSQVLANLLNNATKYTPAGGHIEVGASADDDQLTVIVRDSGVGIAPDMLDSIFDVFVQIERSVTMKQAQGGLGLGLTLVRRLVELHGGTVEAASAGVGQGSTFTLRLPLAHAAARAQAPLAPAAASTPAKLHVLVVDDNEDAAECLAALLTLQGHEVRLAHSGPDALESVHAHIPDVVLLDVGLPGFDGYEVARRVRAQLGARAPRLIAITGFGTREDQRRAHEAGFEAHLVKPVSTALLTQALLR
jgi:PAS domain S-box-containing protein